MSNTATLNPARTSAEAAFLGALLLDGEHVAAAASHLREQDFLDPRNRLVYRAAMGLLGSGAPLDFISLAEALRATGRLEDAGGLVYLGELGQSTTSAFAKHHAGMVLRAAQARELQGLGRGLVTEGERADTTDAAAFAEWTDAKTAALYRILGDRGAGQPLPIGPAVADLVAACAAKAPVRRIPTGIDVLDEGPLSGGYAPGTLNLCAARASVGKTTAALRIARRAAEVGPVLFLSLETSVAQLAARLLAAEAGIDSRDLLAHRLNTGEAAGVQDAQYHLQRLPIEVQATARMSIDNVRMAALSFARRRPGAALVVIDHAGLIASGGRDAYERATTTSNGLQGIARELDGPPLLALCQLNRAIEKRENPWPIRSDLRDSGAYEQDADTLVFLHPETMSNGKATGRLGLSVGKNRDGAAGGRWWLRMDWPRYRILEAEPVL